jgi:acetoin utilization protein AcuB
MIAKHLISEYISPVKPSDTGIDILGMMDEYKISHLPIVNKAELLGVISDTEIYELNKFEDPVSESLSSLKKYYVGEYQHFFDVVKMLSSIKLSIVPVLDEKNNYLGCIERGELVNAFAEMSAIENPGGIIVLEINIKDYLLTEIANIVESNDAKILSLYISSHPNSTKMEVTLKINKIDLRPVIQTFNRYNYIIKASYTENNFDSGLQERFDQFMNYLNL